MAHDYTPAQVVTTVIQCQPGWVPYDGPYQPKCDSLGGGGGGSGFRSAYVRVKQKAPGVCPPWTSTAPKCSIVVYSGVDADPTYSYLEAPISFASEEGVSIRPQSGPPGKQVSLAGKGFAPGETVKVTYSTGLTAPRKLVLCRGMAAANGSFACDGAIPATNFGAARNHSITAKGLSSGKKKVAEFSLATEVTIGDNFFQPVDLSVGAGGTVVWKNHGATEHNVVSDPNANGTFNSDYALSAHISPGGSFKFTVPRGFGPGPWGYRCTLHAGMAGTLRITTG